jgi:sugar phosphate isomerase/epimerase
VIDRRGFLGVAPLAALVAGGRLLDDRLRERETGVSARRAWSGQRSSSLLRPRPRLDRLGVQLYTLREEMAREPERTLEAVAAIGYEEVELAGLYGMTVHEMREKLEAVGLRAASSHHGLDAVRGAWDETLRGALELGQSLVVVPSIPPEERTPEGLRRIADDFNRAGEAARAAGLRFGYHNHDWELRALADGTVPMRLLLERTDAALVDWQMDLFWTVHGGGDVMVYLAATAGRVTSVHVKDRTASGDMVDVGDGAIPFDEILVEAERLGLRHVFVEHDRPEDALESVRRSYQHLTRGAGRDAFDERTA